MGDLPCVITRVWQHRADGSRRRGRLDYEAIDADGRRHRVMTEQGDGLYTVLLTYLGPPLPDPPGQERLEFES